MKKGIKTSIATALAIASMAVFSGCIHDSSSSSATTSVSGVAVDGYIQNGTVTFDGTTTTTDDNGNWTLSISNSDFGSTSKSISVTGGTDSVTGLTLETTLTTTVPESTATTSAIISPLTTMVQKYVSSISGATLSDARTKIAASTGISVSDLDVDPVANVTSSDAINDAIQKVQLATESMSEAGVSDPISSFISQISASSSTVAIDTAIESAINSEVSDSTLKAALVANHKAISSALDESTINSLSSLKQNVKAVVATNQALEDAIKDNNTSGALLIAKSAANTINQVKDTIGTDGSGSVSAAKSVATSNASQEFVDAYDQFASSTTGLAAYLESLAQGNDISTASSAAQAKDTSLDINTSVIDSASTKESEQEAAANTNVAQLTVTKIVFGTSKTIELNSTVSSFDVNKSDVNLSTFYDVNLSESNVSKAFDQEEANLEIKVKKDTSNYLTLTVSNILLDYNADNIKTTIPSGTTISIVEKVNGTTSTYSNTTTSAIVNSDLVFNIGNVINNLSDKTNINNGIAKMETRLDNSTAGESFTVSISLLNIDSSNLIFSNKSKTYTVTIKE